MSGSAVSLPLPNDAGGSGYPGSVGRANSSRKVSGASDTGGPGSAQRCICAAILSALGDIALVVLFAGLGRSSHTRDMTVIGLFETAWPFLAGLAIMWLVLRAWRAPMALVKTGLPLWLGTVAIGMLLRWLTGAGIALAFVMVATLTLGAFLIGWRGIAALVQRLRR